jgi:uncharacterized protein YoxC
VTTQVTEPVQQVTEPVQQVTTQVTEPVQQVTEPVQQVTEPVQQVTTQVTEPVQQVTAPVQQVTEPVQQVTAPVQQVTAPAQQVTDAASGAVEAVNQAAEPVTDAATVAANELAAETATAVAGANKPTEAALEQATDASTALSDTVATMLAGAGGGPGGTFGGPGGTFGGPGAVPGLVDDSTTALGTGIADIGQRVSTDGRAFDALPFETPGLIAGADEALLVTAGLVTLAGFALAVKGSGPSGVLSAQFYLANVRKIPLLCGVREIVNRHVSAGAAYLGRAGGVSSAVKAVVAPEQLAQAVRDGFRRGAGRLGTEDDGIGDTRLFMQIGMLLGTVYLAFLTVWFWATRLRWNPRM